ncbi:MAG: HIT family protein [Erysipelotrichaceae bacterium]
MCIFCKIANHEIPSYTLYEDDDVLAFLDISQVTKGHTLVVPKTHYANLLECDPKDLAKVMDVVQKVGNNLMAHSGCSGLNVLSNVNELAGQSVFHFHVHLIPRYDQNDALQLAFQPSEPQDLAALAAQFALK